MKQAVLPILLALASGAALACPGGDKATSAQAPAATTVAGAQPTLSQQIKAEAEKKQAKAAETKKSKS